MNKQTLIKLIESEFGSISNTEKFEISVNTDSRLRLKYLTERVSYSISAYFEDDSYLGCIATMRHPDPGEDWLRGNDLSDGKLNGSTWSCIVSDIACYEDRLDQ